MKKGNYNRLKGALGDLGVTNKELAEGLGVSRTAVSTWCTNDKQPSLETLYRIAEYLNIDVRDLLVPNKLSASSQKKK